MLAGKLLTLPAPCHRRNIKLQHSSSRARTGLRLQCSSTPTSTPAVDDAPSARTWPIPQNASQQTQQAIQAIEAAWRAGISRQRVELLLPLIGATDLDDWPGGIRQQFKAAQPLVESIVRSIKQLQGLQGPMSAELWDQGDAVGAWTSASLVFILFPTAQVVDKLRRIVEAPSGRSPPQLTVIVNPQWESKGNLVSEFGFGRRRQESEAFAASFQQTYTNKQQRIYGDSLRILRVFPSGFQVHQVDRRGQSELLVTEPGPLAPSYARLEAVLKARPGSSMNKTWLERAKEEYKFNQDSLKPPV